MLLIEVNIVEYIEGHRIKKSQEDREKINQFNAMFRDKKCETESEILLPPVCFFKEECAVVHYESEI